MAKTTNIDIASIVLAISEEIAKKFEITQQNTLNSLVQNFVQDFFKRSEKYLIQIEKVEKNTNTLENIFESINKLASIQEDFLTSLVVKPEPVNPEVKPEPVNPEVKPEPVNPEVKPEPVNEQEKLSLSDSSQEEVVVRLDNIQKILEGFIDTKTSFVREEKYPHLFTTFFKKILKEETKTTSSKSDKIKNNKEDNKNNKEDVFQEPTQPDSFLEKRSIPVLFDGFSENGYAELMMYLPEIIKEAIKPLLTKENQQTLKLNRGGMGEGLLDKLSAFLPSSTILKGGLAALGIIGGALSLLYGLSTTDAFKGLAKIVGQGSLLIAKNLSPALTKFVADTAMKLLNLPLTLLKTFGNTIGQLITTQGAKILSKIGLESLAKTLPKIVSGIGKALTKIPFIGGLVSLGFAVSRLIKGDYVGAGLDVLAGLAMLIPPPFGMMVSFAIDGINAFLDFQSGGIGTEESRAKKSGMVMGVVKWLGSALYKVFSNLPVFGPMLRAFNEFKNDNYEEGIKQLLYINPAFELIGALLGDKNTGVMTRTTASGINLIGKLVGWVGKTVYKGLKSLLIIGPMLKAAEAFYNEDYVQGIKQLVYINPGFEFIGALLGDKEASGVSKTFASVFRVTGKLIAWLAKALYKGFKALPIVGPALKAVEEFVSGNFAKGFKQLLYINPVFEMLGTLLFNDRETTPMAKMAAGIFSIIGKVGSWLSKTLWKVISNLPIVGPAVKAADELLSGNFLKAFKQFAYIFPAFEILGALLGDTETTPIGRFGAGMIKGITSIVSKIGKWVGDKIWKIMSNLPIVGPAIKAAKELFSGNFGKAFKQMLYINPAFEFIGALLGDEEVGGVSSFAAQPIRFTTNLLYNAGKWLKEKLFKMPIIGPIFTGFEQIFSGEGIIKGFKTMAKGIPIIGGIISFLDSDETVQDNNQFKPEKFNPFKALKDMVLAKAKKWWKSIFSWTRWLARRVLPTNVIKFLDSDTNENEKSEGKQETESSTGSNNLTTIQKIGRFGTGMIKGIADSLGITNKPATSDEQQTSITTSKSQTPAPVSQIKKTNDTPVEEAPTAFEQRINSMHTQNAKFVPLPGQDTLFEDDKVLITPTPINAKQQDLVEPVVKSSLVPIVQPEINQEIQSNNERFKNVESQFEGIELSRMPTLSPANTFKDVAELKTTKNQPLLNVFVKDFSDELLTKLSIILDKQEQTEEKNNTKEAIVANYKPSVTEKIFIKLFGKETIEKFKEKIQQKEEKNNLVTNVLGKETTEKLKEEIKSKDPFQVHISQMRERKKKDLAETEQAKDIAKQMGLNSEQLSYQKEQGLITTINGEKVPEKYVKLQTPKNSKAILDESKRKESADNIETNLRLERESPNIEPLSIIKNFATNTLKEVLQSGDTALLETIAGNTDDTNKNLNNLAVGFNNLAKALEKLGVSVSKQDSQQTVVLGGQTSTNVNKGGLGRGTQYGKVGNPAITEFRKMVEMNRQQPV